MMIKTGDRVRILGNDVEGVSFEQWAGMEATVLDLPERNMLGFKMAYLGELSKARPDGSDTPVFYWILEDLELV